MSQSYKHGVFNALTQALSPGWTVKHTTDSRPGDLLDPAAAPGKGWHRSTEVGSLVSLVQDPLVGQHQTDFFSAAFL